MDPSRDHERRASNPTSTSLGDDNVTSGQPSLTPTPQIPPPNHPAPTDDHANTQPNTPAPATGQQPQASGSGSRQIESRADPQREATNRPVQNPENVAIRQPEVTTVQPEAYSPQPQPRRIRSTTVASRPSNGYNGQEIRPPPPILTNPIRGSITGSPERINLSDPEIHSDGSHPLPPLPGHVLPDIRSTRLENGSRLPSIRAPNRRGSGLDYIVPNEKIAERSVGERLLPTLEVARIERDKYALKARMTGYALNIAIGLQVLLGALTTGLSAATSGHNASISTAILGGIATLVASYLARARGSNEPELSIARVKDLEQFIRECEAFIMDHGHNIGTQFDDRLLDLRRRFEELLGNADGQRRLAPPV